MITNMGWTETAARAGRGQNAVASVADLALGAHACTLATCD